MTVLTEVFEVEEGPAKPTTSAGGHGQPGQQQQHHHTTVEPRQQGRAGAQGRRRGRRGEVDGEKSW